MRKDFDIDPDRMSGGIGRTNKDVANAANLAMNQQRTQKKIAREHKPIRPSSFANMLEADNNSMVPDSFHHPIKSLEECIMNNTVQETHLSYTQSYEISTKVGAEVDSKGNIKPNAQITISRKLESGDEIRELVHADISRGVEEVMDAIDQVLKRGAQ